MSEMDDAYANAAYIEGADEYPVRWAEASAKLRAARQGNWAVPYGDSARQCFDLIHPEGPSNGVMVFVHGGYWMRFGREDWSFLAHGALEAGWAVAIPGYDLCPEVRIGEITAQIAAAITEIAQCVPGPMVLAGHSAGGHLVARMGCADVALAPDVRDRIKRIVPISPVADLGPLTQTKMNEVLRIDEAEVSAESPLLHPSPDADVCIWVGADERPAFVDQALRLGAAWNAPVVEDAGKHHFNVIDGLVDPNSMLTHAVIGGI